MEEPLKAALCRTFGAHRLRIPNPGLTAGATHCRTFGAEFLAENRIPILVGAPPTVDIQSAMRPEGPAVNRPGRRPGSSDPKKSSAEGAALLTPAIVKLCESLGKAGVCRMKLFMVE